MFCLIWYHFYNLKPATLLKVTLLHGCTPRFLNGKNGTKSCKASHMHTGTTGANANNTHITCKTHVHDKQ